MAFRLTTCVLLVLLQIACNEAGRPSLHKALSVDEQLGGGAEGDEKVEKLSAAKEVVEDKNLESESIESQDTPCTKAGGCICATVEAMRNCNR
mmetsp:Transcript_52181/g.93592  ORF Transcript_52181/g.93592 Transcript_52181/m.93592 type:complete len:93 (+) Transcript_52181:73-351(+)